MREKEISLLTVIPNTGDATSTHRGFTPMIYLKKHLMPHLNLAFDKDVSVDTAIQYDGAFLQRPFDAGSHLALAKILKHVGIPLWCDWDDDLFSVPPVNPSYRIYGQPIVKESVAAIAKLSTIITVSTEELAAVMKKHNSNVVVVPNATNDWLDPVRKAQKPNKIVMWRGSDTHQQDLLDVSPQILEAARKHPDWVFMFWGYRPNWLIERQPNCIFEGGVDILSFYRRYQQIAPAVTIVPLEDIPFNHAKSMMAWQQAVQANGVCIAPGGHKFREWEKPGCLTYAVGNAEDFKKKLLDCMEGRVNITAESDKGAEFIRRNLMLSDVNKLRMNVVNELVGRKL